MQFSIHSAIADDIKERIEKGTLDIGLLMEPVDVGKYKFIRMPQKEKWGILVRKDSELASWFGDYVDLYIYRRISVT